MATADTSTISRSTFSRPRLSDIAPESTRPTVLPTAPTTSPMRATLPMPASVPNGTSWLISPSPAMAPMK